MSVSGVMPVMVALLLLAIGAIVSGWIVFRLLRRRKAAPFLSSLGVLGIAASVLIGGGGLLIGLVKAFGAVGGESIDPSQKARIPSILIALVVERTLAPSRRPEPPST